MKKTIVIGLLIALICFLFCGCTPEETESASHDVKFPSVNTEQGYFPDGTEPEGDSQQPKTEPDSGMESQAPREDNTDPAIASEEIPDDEVVSDFVVDGGDEFGFGGN